MKISVFGLGYVGTVSAACFADAGHLVIGVDPSAIKVDSINAGQAPIIESGLAEIIARVVEQKKLRAVATAAEAVAGTDISFICVGTPSQPNGSLDVSAVRGVCLEIGREMRRKDSRHTVVLRSTVLPGTIRNVVIPALEEGSGMNAITDFGVASNPEFLRESTAIFDFYNPPKTVVGTDDPATGDLVLEIYGALPGPKIKTSIGVAEMVKYADNSWHATKVAFANEIGNICQAVGIDSHSVMDIFVQDLKLNISSYYMKPGFAFGGSCLPKDVRALTAKGRELSLELPLLQSLMPSNRHQIERAFRLITAKGVHKIGVLGFAFKSGTDDMRESPIIELIEQLHGRGFTLRIFDPSVELSRIQGANLDYLSNSAPHISGMLAGSVAEVIDFAELVIIGNNDRSFHTIGELLRPGQSVVDLVRVPGLEAACADYTGVNW